MKRIMQWANFKIGGKIQSVPMVAGGGCLTGDAPEGAELVSVTPAYSVWLDDGLVVNTLEDPDSKKARTDQQAASYAEKAKEDAAKEARKARAVVLSAEGLTNAQIARRIGTTEQAVNIWLARASPAVR